MWSRRLVLFGERRCFQSRECGIFDEPVLAIWGILHCFHEVGDIHAMLEGIKEWPHEVDSRMEFDIVNFDLICDIVTAFVD